MEHSSETVNGAIDQSAGKAQRAQALSLASFLASLSVSASFLGVGVAVFVLLKDYCVQIYQPRVHALGDRQPGALRPGPISWVMPFLRLTDRAVLDFCGVDSYLFLRYLRTMILIFGPLSLVIVPSLLSLNLVNASGRRNRAYGMDELSWSNVATADTARLWGHLCCAICIVLYSCFVITHELNYYIRFLQIHTTSTAAKSHFVLLTDIPTGMQKENELNQFFENLLGRSPRMKILHHEETLSDAISKRQVIRTDLKKAETRPIKQAHANQRRGAGQSMTLGRHDVTGTKSRSSVFVRDVERDSWVLRLPFLGRQEDKTVFLRKELAKLDREIEEKQHGFKSSPALRWAVLQFYDYFLAQAVGGSPIHSFPISMLTTDLGTSKDNILWCNLGSTWLDRELRSVFVFVLSVALVLAWTIPIAFTGVLSQLSYLAELLPWLGWVSSMPVWLVALLQGVLPQIALSVLMLIFPDILRAVIRQKRQFTKTAVELSLQKIYFAFLFLYFFTVSISSGIVTVLAQTLNSTEFGPVVLAQNLPKASNYFMSYVLLQAFFVSGSIFVQLTGALRWTLNNVTITTPQEHATKIYTSVIQWGTFFPVYTNLGCIVIVFSAIAPIILPIGSLAFVILWIAHRYSCLYVNRHESDNGGRLYPAALFQLFTGLYVLQLCLVGLFALGQNAHGARGCIPQAAMMGFALVCTVLYHWKLVEVYTPLISRTVTDDTRKERAEERTPSDTR